MNSKILNLSIPVFLLSICFTHIHHGTIAVDAIRYAHIAQLIIENNDWFSLYDAYDQRAYANKPPFLFWILACLFKVFGFSTFIAKLPSTVFAFIAMLLLWKLVSNIYSERVAIFALLSLVLSPYFGKDLIDLNFESLVFLGSILCLGSLIFWDRSKNYHYGWLFGLGLFFVIQGKPPYILLILAPSILWALLRKMPGSLKFILTSLPFFLSGAIWFLLAGESYTSAAIENQVEGPLTLTRGFYYNIYLWTKGSIETFPLPLFFGIAGIYGLVRNIKGIKSFELLLLSWSATAIPIVFMVDSRARYLVIPMIPLIILSGLIISRLLHFIDTKFIKVILLILSPIISIIFISNMAIIHRSHEVITYLKSNPETLKETDLICVNHKKDYRDWSAVRNSELLLKLELNEKARFFHSDDVAKIADNKFFLSDKRCYGHLLNENVPVIVVEEYPDGARMLQIENEKDRS